MDTLGSVEGGDHDPGSQAAVGAAHRDGSRRARAGPETQALPDAVEAVIAPAIERALAIYQQMRPRDQSVIVQARKILTQHIYGMVDRGERHEQRLTVGGLAHLKAVEREHGIKSANGAGVGA